MVVSVVQRSGFELLVVVVVVVVIIVVESFVELSGWVRR